MSDELNYTNIDRPYNNSLNRMTIESLGEVQPTSGMGAIYGQKSIQETTTIDNPSQMSENVIDGSSITNLWIKSFIKSQNYKPKSAGFLIDGLAGYIEAMNIYISGSIVGGTLNIPDTTTANSFHVDANGNTWWGTNVATGYATAPAYILNTGAGRMANGNFIWDVSGNVTIAGSFTSTATITGGTIQTATSGARSVLNSSGLAIYDATTQRAKIGSDGSGWLGSSDKISWTTAGAVTISGFTINSTSLTVVSGGNTVILSSGATALTAGPTGSPTVTITQAGAITATSGTIGGCTLAATSISSTSFVSGALGSGWRITSTGSAELQDAIIRGSIRTSVFEKDNLSAVNGLVLISKADVLNADMTALDASTLTISGETSFVANEVLRLKDGTNDEWLLVTDASAAPIYTVTRDLAAAYGADTNPIWKKGTAVVSMGVGTGTKTGFILLDSSSSNSPYIDVYGRNSNTYSDYTLHGRFGWLKGITDSDLGLNSTDTWGFYTDNAYIKGKVVVGTSGYVLGGQTDYNTGTGFFLGYSGGAYKLSIGNPSGNYITWDNSYLRIKGNLDLTSIFNNIVYAVADLPIPPTNEGPNPPSGYDY